MSMNVSEARNSVKLENDTIVRISPDCFTRTHSVRGNQMIVAIEESMVRKVNVSVVMG